MVKQSDSSGITERQAKAFEIVETPLRWQLLWSFLFLLLISSAIIYIQIRPNLGKPRGPKVLQARVTMKGVEVGVSGFMSEYGRLPGESVSVEAHPVQTQGQWFDDLFGTHSHVNTRAIPFFEPAAARNGKNGLDRLPNGQPRLLDPWGTVYWAHFDVNSDAKIKSPETGLDITEHLILIWSAGRDGNPATWHDNVKSWD